MWVPSCPPVSFSFFPLHGLIHVRTLNLVSMFWCNATIIVLFFISVLSVFFLILPIVIIRRILFFSLDRYLKKRKLIGLVMIFLFFSFADIYTNNKRKKKKKDITIVYEKLDKYLLEKRKTSERERDKIIHKCSVFRSKAISSWSYHNLI